MDSVASLAALTTGLEADARLLRHHVRVQRRWNVRFGSILLKKDFERVGRATLIQKQHLKRNIDSRNYPKGFNSCVLQACRGLFQQYRS